MPLLLKHPVTDDLLPSLEGTEVLQSSNPSECVVKGVMFGGRKALLLEAFGETGYYDTLVGLSPRTLHFARNPVATAWAEFSTLVEYDRAIYARWHSTHPHILALLGASSAELGIGTVYRSLDNEELVKFFERLALFHREYQKFGTLTFDRSSEKSAVMSYHDYQCYSPIFCASGFGFWYEAILRHGGRNPHVQHTRCTCRGDGVCTYELRWE